MLQGRGEEEVLTDTDNTIDSNALTRSNTPGSGLPCWAKSLVEWEVAKDISHLVVAQATPVKHME